MRNLFLALFTLLNLSIFAQSDSTLLREVVLISSKTTLKNPFLVNDLPIIVYPENEKESFISIQEGLENISLIDLQQRGPIDIQSDLSIRGGTFNQSLILIDGVPYSDPQTGHHNMNLPFALNDIEMIEVSTGNSRLLGPQAFSGAVNFSIATDTGFYHQIQFFGGRHGLLGMYAKSGFQLKKHQFQISLNGSRSDGYMRNTDFTQGGAMLNWSHPIDHGEIKVFAATLGKAFGAQNFYSTNYPTQFENTRGWMGHIAFNQRRKSFIHRGFLSFRNHRDRFELFRESTNYYQWNGDDLIMNTDTAPDWYAGPNFHRSRVATGEYSMEYNWSNRQKTTAAIQARGENVVSNVLGDSIPKPIETSDGGTYTKGRRRTNTSLTLNHHIEYGRWRVSGGVLVNVNSDYSPQVNPGVHFGYFVNEHWKWVYTINRSFRTPTFTELYYNVGGALGSENLSPENAWVQNFGTEIQLKNTRWYAAIHHRFTQNGIDWLENENTIEASNINTIHFYGLDFNASLKWKSSWIEQLQVGYSYLQGSHDREERSIYALRYLRHNTVLHGVHQLGESIRLHWTGRLQDRYASNSDEEQSPFFTLSLSLNYKTRNNWSAQISVQNATNTQFSDRFGIPQPGFWPMIRIGKEF